MRSLSYKSLAARSRQRGLRLYRLVQLWQRPKKLTCVCAHASGLALAQGGAAATAGRVLCAQESTGPDGTLRFWW